MPTYAQEFARGAAKGREHRAAGIMLEKFSKLRAPAWIDGYKHGWHS